MTEGQHERASQLIEALLQPVKPEGRGVQTRISEYEATEVLEVAGQLSAVAPELTVPAFERLLADAVRLELGDEDPGFYWSIWRPAIEVTEATLRLDSTLNLLVSGLRDGVKSFVELRETRLQTCCDRIWTATRPSGEGSPSTRCRCVRSWRPNLEDVLLPGDSVFDRLTFHEVVILLGDHFARLSPSERERVLALVESGPAESREEGDNYADLWRWRLLLVLPIELLPNRLQDLAQTFRRAIWNARAVDLPRLSPSILRQAAGIAR